MTTVLVTGVGSGVALSIVKALARANEVHGRGYSILGADANWRTGPLYVLDAGYLVPRVDDAAYVPRMIEVCREAAVDYLIPGTDLELVTLCDHRAQIETAGTHVIVNSRATIDAGFDKLETARFLEREGFPFPRTCLVDRDAAHDGTLAYPYIMKPRYGSGSVGLARVHDEHDRARHLRACPDEMIAQELIPGTEYTCGLAFGADGSLLRTIVLERTLKKGFTQFATVVEEPRVDETIRGIAAVLPGLGAYNLQGRMHGGRFTIFEINPRFSGTTAFRAVAGQNEPDLYIQHHQGGELPRLDEQRTGLSMSRFLNEVYFDQAAADELISRQHVANGGFTYGLKP